MNRTPIKGKALSSRDRFPCNQYPGGVCPKRSPACQDKCPEFIAAKDENTRRKAQEKAKRYAANDYDKVKIDSVVKGSRKKLRER